MVTDQKNRVYWVYDLHVTNQAPADKEALRLELQEAIVTFRQQATLGVQIAGFIATADSLLLVYGFAQHQSGIFLIASLTPIILLIAYVEILKSALPVGYVAMVLERELGLSKAPLATVFAFRMIHSAQPTGGTFQGINDSDLQESLFSAPARIAFASTPAYVLYAIFLAQIGLFLISIFVENFRFV
jgi:hypothetical protein